jgi:hypothetical protein
MTQSTSLVERLRKMLGMGSTPTPPASEPTPVPPAEEPAVPPSPPERPVGPTVGSG